MNIAIIYGGKSSEHEVSLKSASSIIRTIDKKYKLHLIGISKSGAWYLHGDEERERIIKNEKAVLKIKKDEAKRVSVIPGGGIKKGLKALLYIFYIFYFKFAAAFCISASTALFISTTLIVSIFHSLFVLVILISISLEKLFPPSVALDIISLKTSTKICF